MAWDREARGIPIGRAAEVNLRNNHAQYIFTWYLKLRANALDVLLIRSQVRVDSCDQYNAVDGHQEAAIKWHTSCSSKQGVVGVFEQLAGDPLASSPKATASLSCPPLMTTYACLAGVPVASTFVLVRRV